MDGLKRKQGVLSATTDKSRRPKTRNVNLLCFLVYLPFTYAQSKISRNLHTLCHSISLSSPPFPIHISSLYIQTQPQAPQTPQPPTPNHGCAQPRIRSFTSEPGWKERPHFSNRSQIVTPRLWQSNGFSRWPVIVCDGGGSGVLNDAYMSRFRNGSDNSPMVGEIERPQTP